MGVCGWRGLKGEEGGKGGDGLKYGHGRGEGGRKRGALHSDGV